MGSSNGNNLLPISCHLPYCTQKDQNSVEFWPFLSAIGLKRVANMKMAMHFAESVSTHSKIHDARAPNAIGF